ncbi:MAG: choice-of-anchor D domain-containing protein [Candidatus Acidiferrum sp.]
MSPTPSLIKGSLAGRVACFASCLLLLSGFVVSSATAQSQVFQKWDATFDAAGSFDTPVALTSDVQGNAYVTGSSCVVSSCSDQEALTIKYGPKGQFLWKAWLKGAGGFAQGEDVAVDSAGNVYVLFLAYLPVSQFHPTTNPEVATAKYSPAGVRQWINFIASTSSETNTPVKLAVSPTGNVFITLIAQQLSGTSSDAITIKYNTSGKQLWSKVAAPTPNASNSPLGVKLDTSENVYVPVFSNVNAGEHASLFFKYDTNGNFLKSFGGNILGTIAAFDVDSRGNSFVAGSGPPQNPFGGGAYVVANFHSDGTVAWNSGLTLPLNVFPDGATFNSLATDPAGNVFIATSLRTTNTEPNIGLIKFDFSGHQSWVTQYNVPTGGGSDFATAVAVNSAGEAYLTGSTNPGSDPDAACCAVTLKYDPSGKLIWNEVWLQGSTNFYDTVNPIAMVVGGAGGLLGIGQSIFTISGSTDWVVVDFVQDAAEFNVLALDFGSQSIKTQSAAKPVTLTNTAEVPLIIDAIDVTGDFRLVNTCPATLAAGASCVVNVSFDPEATGSGVGTLTVRDDWAGSTVHPQTVQLTGTGVD